MSERIALIGFVNTEEILADTVKRQTPDVMVDGYEVLPNEAFGRIVDERYPLYGLNDQNEFGLHNLDWLAQLKTLGYSAINLGPIPAVMMTEDTLVSTGASYIGPRKNELGVELDKSRIAEIFPAETEIIPLTRILESTNREEIKKALEELGGNAVIKFVGEYTKYYQDSETRRVRMMEEFEDNDELEDFISNSIKASGRVVLQKRIDGQQFSYTCAVDGTGAVFRLGENICYKNRYDGDTGPLCDATGGLSINNSLPFLSPEDLEHIKDSMVLPYSAYLENNFGRPPQTFLNLDLIRDKTDHIYLLEVNNREPGGHTMANLLGGLDTPVAEVLEATQTGRLAEIDPAYKTGASIVVSAYPDNFPYPFESDEARPTVEIPKLRHDDEVRMYTGWVDVENDEGDTVIVRPQLSPTMIFANHSSSVSEARAKVYDRIRSVVPEMFDYRKDIGSGELSPRE